MRSVILTLLVLLTAAQLSAQPCSTIGQTPQTAFPVCGTRNFNQTSVPVCGDRPVATRTCANNRPPLSDVNPFWYKFTCFTAGTLGFVITPVNLGDDYDWQLFDITGRPLDEVYTNPDIVVAANWSGEVGVTGASAGGRQLEVCGGAGLPLFSAMPTLQAGHEYLLLISHFDGDSQSGYQLSFNGGTASITDPGTPEIRRATYHCDNNTIGVKLNKRLKCNSLATNGTDFILAGAPANIMSAAGINCNNGFDMDSLVLTLDRPLPAGTYTLNVKNGTDGNAVLDACDNALTTPVSFTVPPQAPSLPDHVTPVDCRPNKVQLVFSQPIRCSSIAADGSDFAISGTAPLAVTSINSTCANGLTYAVELLLDRTIYLKGSYQVTIQQGSDGGTLTSECGLSTPAGATVAFETKDTVNADFSYTISLDCENDTVFLRHDGANEVSSWQWSSDGEDFSTEQNPVKIYTVFGRHDIQLTVSNGVCSDSASASILLNNELKADFTAAPDLLCPQDMATFTDKSIGNIISYLWDFGNGVVTSAPVPQPQSYPQLNTERIYNVSLVVQNDMNCYDTAVHPVKVVPSCYIDVPTAFTPNNDGRNDYLYPLNGYKAINLKFSVYNRLGQLVFETNDWMRRWNGAVNGKMQDPGTYVWMLTYTNRDTGEKVFKKGTTVLIR